MKSIGWKSNLPEDPGTDVDAECTKEYGFAGYHCCPRKGGHLSAVFKGSGSAMLAYGNCGKDGYVWVSINGKEFNRCTKGMKNVATFSYKKGDILRIQEFKGVIKIYSFDKENPNNWEQVMFRSMIATLQIMKQDFFPSNEMFLLENVA